MKSLTYKEDIERDENGDRPCLTFFVDGTWVLVAPNYSFDRDGTYDWNLSVTLTGKWKTELREITMNIDSAVKLDCYTGEILEIQLGMEGNKDWVADQGFSFDDAPVRLSNIPSVLFHYSEFRKFVPGNYRNDLDGEEK